ncbi:MAG: M24 family metallopeptidase, partial [Desulfohalobiaceae bacterium]|nr:M24 family metallopeptidase [Desulfohalobiaceae bacterium]
EVFSGIQGFVLSGVSESGLAWEAEKMFRENGASELAFAPIVAFGPNGALPHSIPGARVLEDNLPVLMDMGGRKKEYCSDQTRSFWNGEEPSDIFKRTLEQVQEAQRLAIEAIRPGMELKDLYRVAYDFFAGRGVEKHFTHGLGHGIGLETHEFPGIGPKSVGILEPGMVITVEPGLYYPDWGGVRWEHMVLVTEDGARVL